jgi:hypothetical protein
MFHRWVKTEGVCYPVAADFDIYQYFWLLLDPIQYPHLRALAIRILSFPVLSEDVERSFSIAAKNKNNYFRRR